MRSKMSTKIIKFFKKGVISCLSEALKRPEYGLKVRLCEGISESKMA